MTNEAANDILRAAQARLLEQPFSALLNAEILAIGPGRCELRVPVRRDLQQQHGFLHGGVVSYAADNALTIAGYRAINQAVVTSEFKINYVRPAIGDAIVARAQCVHAGKTQAVCRCEVYAVSDGTEKLCAVAQGTVALLSKPAG